MAAVRFEVRVNGRPVCVAGLDGFGFLQAQIQSTRFAGERDPAPFPPEPPSEHLELLVGGHDFVVGDVGWSQISLRIGDEVTVRVLGPGTNDPPVEINPLIGPDDLPF